MSRLLDSVATHYFSQRAVDRGKDAVGRRLRPHLGELRVRTRSGVLMQLDPRDVIQYSILLTGEWEPAETVALRGELRRGDVVYDVGANVGYFTLLAAAIVGEEGHVYAFEPNPPTVARLQSNIECNGFSNVTVVPVALGDRSDRVRFHSAGAGNTGASSLRDGVGDTDDHEVELAPLDDVIVERGLRSPDVMKMDIEGAELLALSGAERTLRSSTLRSLLAEISDRFLGELGGSEAELLDALDAADFERVREVSRHPRTEPDGRPFQYTALFRRSVEVGESSPSTPMDIVE